MKAKRMFKKLGYKFIENKECIIYSFITMRRFIFNKSKKEIVVNLNIISVDELKAIIKQAQELGWLDE